MVRTFLVGTALAIGLTSYASAAVKPAPVGVANSAIVKVTEGCGRGWWRGPGGRCHPMFDGRACPPGYHLGPERHRCWPN